jgi:hypothetical protein
LERVVMKLIYLEWCDAVAFGNEWQSGDAAREWGEKADWLIRECGWLLEEKKEYIVIASCWKKEDDYIYEQFMHLRKIPKTWIKKRKNIKL